jgi:hypothetical protein
MGFAISKSRKLLFDRDLEIAYCHFCDNWQTL